MKKLIINDDTEFAETDENTEYERNLFLKAVGLSILCVLILGYHYTKKGLEDGFQNGDGAAEIMNLEKSSDSSELNKNSRIKIIGMINPKLFPAGNFRVTDNGAYLVGMTENRTVAYDVQAGKSVELDISDPILFPKTAFIGNREIVISTDDGYKVFSLKNGDQRLSVRVPGGMEAIAVSSDELLIAGITRTDGTIKIWDTGRGKLLGTANGDPNSLRPTLTFKGHDRLSVYEISESRSRIMNVAIPSMDIKTTAWQDFGDINLEFTSGGRLLAGGNTDRFIENQELLIFDGENAVFAGRISLLNSDGRIIENMQAVTIDKSGFVSLVKLSAESNLAIAEDQADKKDKILLKTEPGVIIADVSPSGKSIVLTTPSGKATVLQISGN